MTVSELIAVRPGPGHGNFLRLGGFKMQWQVTLDGEPVRDCFMASAAGGWVEVYRRTADGAFALDPPATRRLHGTVEVRVLPK